MSRALSGPTPVPLRQPMIVLVADTEGGRGLVDLLSRRASSPLEAKLFRAQPSLLDGVSADQELSETLRSADAIVVDVDLAAAAGDLLAALQGLAQECRGALVVLSQQPSLRLATSVIRNGAEDFLVTREMTASSLERSLLLAVERKRRLLKLPTEVSGRSESLSDFTLAIDGADDGLWVWDLESGALRLSTQWLDLVRATDEHQATSAHEATYWFDRIHPEDRENFRRDLQAHLRNETTQFSNEHRLRDDRGGYRWVSCRGKATGNNAGDNHPTHIAGSLIDISQRKHEEQRMAEAAMHDPLTGLPNRSLFLDRLSQSLARGHRRGNYRFAVLFLDLDRFKAINDSLGHSIGDRLLASVGHRLEDLLRPTDWVARIGGDEFALLADDLNEPSDATRVARRVLQKLALPHTIDGREVYTTASIGVTLSGPLYQEATEMLRDADNAMYRAKGLGRARYQLFDPQMHETAMRQLALENDLRRALLHNELTLRYQPIVRLDNGVIEGFEALVRWQHPERGLLPPDEFIGIAEETGAIHQIGRWVLDGACHQAAQWQRLHPRSKPLTMSVNISGREFLKEDLIDRVRSSLESSRISPGSLRLELTETSLMERPEIARERIDELKRQSVRLHLDDFGTGYCSLSYLQKLPTDTLKIDRSFISQINETGIAGHIIETIVSLAHRLGIGVSAEGLETSAQVETLRGLSCTHGQGFFFSEAVVPEEAEAMLALGRLSGPN